MNMVLGSSNCRILELFFIKSVCWNLPDLWWQTYHNLPHPPCCEEILDIVRHIWTAFLILVYASVRNRTSCQAPRVNRICTRRLAFIWIFYSASNIKHSPKNGKCCSRALRPMRWWNICDSREACYTSSFTSLPTITWTCVCQQVCKFL